VLEAADIRCALVIPYAWNKNALLLGVTFVVELSSTTTAEDDVTLIGSGTGNNETGGVVDIAFCVRFARTVVVRDTRIIGLTGNDNALCTATSEMAALRNAIKRTLTCIWGLARSNNAFIL
jgi:hypothetical protein